MRSKHIMKRLMAVLLMVVGCLFVATGAQADKIDKAQQHVDAGRQLQTVQMNREARNEFDQADALLRAAIVKNPHDAKTHYRAAIVYFNMGDSNEAERRFQVIRDVLKSSEYCRKIAHYYVDMCMAQLPRMGVMGSKPVKAHSLAEKAISYDRSSRDTIGQECFKYGEGFFKANNHKYAEKYFDFIRKYSPTWSEKVAQLYFDAGLKASNEDQKINFFSKGDKYSQGQNKAMSVKIMSQAEKISDYKCLSVYKIAWNLYPVRTEQSQKAGERLNRIGRDDLDMKDPPDPRADFYVDLAIKMAKGINLFLRVYEKGEKPVYILNDNKCSDHYIRGAFGTRVKLQRKKGNYELMTRDGKRHQRGHASEALREDFKVCAIGSCDMRIVYW